MKSKTKPQKLNKSQKNITTLLWMKNGKSETYRKHDEDVYIHTKHLSKWMNTSVHKYKPLVIASDWMKNHLRRNLKKLSTIWTRNENWSIWNNYTCTEICPSKYMYNWPPWLLAPLDGVSSTGVHFFQNLFFNQAQYSFLFWMPRCHNSNVLFSFVLTLYLLVISYSELVKISVAS